MAGQPRCAGAASTATRGWLVALPVVALVVVVLQLTAPVCESAPVTLDAAPEGTADDAAGPEPASSNLVPGKVREREGGAEVRERDGNKRDASTARVGKLHTHQYMCL